MLFAGSIGAEGPSYEERASAPRPRHAGLPDLALHLDALEARVVGQRLVRGELRSPFVLRTASPPIASIEGNADRALSQVLHDDFARE